MTSTSVAMGRKATQSDVCQRLKTSRSVSRTTVVLEESGGTGELRPCCSRALLDGIRTGIGLAGKQPRHVFLLQRADAVAELGGALEFKFLGGFAHLFFELLEQLSELLLVLDFGGCRVESLVVDRNGNVVGFYNASELHIHGLHDGHWRDVVFLVERHLLRSAAVGLVDGLIHGISAPVGVKNGAALNVPGAAADGLNQRSGAAQVTFFVGIENGDERNFGEVEPFAKQVNANKHIKFAAAQIAQNLDAVERFHFRMKIAAAHANFGEVFRKVFRHAFGQGGDQDALAFLGADANLFQQVIHLAFYGTDFYFRVHEAGRANHLLHDDAARASEFVRTRRRRNVNYLIHAVLEFLEGERAIVERGGHAEPIITERLFARAVPMKHAPDLWNGLVRFVDEKQIVLRNVIEKSWRSFAGQTATKMA